MLRRGLLLCLAICLLFAQAASAQALTGPLTAAELVAWRDTIRRYALALPYAGDPQQAGEAASEDTWLLAYEDLMFVSTSPGLEGEENPIAEVELLTGAVQGPRGIAVGDAWEKVVAAFANENEILLGDTRYATLYMQQEDALSGERGWGWVLRRNQTIDGIEYGVSIPAPGLEGFRQDWYLLYIIEDGVVSAIRAGGFEALVSQGDSDTGMQAVALAARAVAFAPGIEAGAAGFSEKDLVYGDLMLTAAVVEDVRKLLGDPLTEETDAEAGIRTLAYGHVLFECAENAGSWAVEAMLVSGGDTPGPRGLQIGDTRASVEARFGPSEDGTYTCVTQAGKTYTLLCTFTNDTLTEYLLYRL